MKYCLLFYLFFILTPCKISKITHQTHIKKLKSLKLHQSKGKNSKLHKSATDPIVKFQGFDIFICKFEEWFLFIFHKKVPYIHTTILNNIFLDKPFYSRFLSYSIPLEGFHHVKISIYLINLLLHLGWTYEKVRFLDFFDHLSSLVDKQRKWKEAIYLIGIDIWLTTHPFLST